MKIYSYDPASQKRKNRPTESGVGKRYLERTCVSYLFKIRRRFVKRVTSRNSARSPLRVFSPFARLR